MNYFSYRFVHDIHLSLHRKIRNMFMQIFGEEANFPKQDLEKIAGHCGVFEINIPRIHELNLQQLAKRKLLNPFKWLEFGFAILFELPQWAVKRITTETTKTYYINMHEELFNLLRISVNSTQTSTAINTFHKIYLPSKFKLQADALLELINKLENDPSQKQACLDAIDQLRQAAPKRPHVPTIVLAITSMVSLVFSAGLSLVLDLPWAILRRILAPSRYIIRPFLQYARTDTKKWLITLGIALFITACIALAVFTGGGSLVIGGTTLLSSFGFLTPVMTGIAGLCASLASAVGAASTAAVMCVNAAFVLAAGITSVTFLQKITMGWVDFDYAMNRLNAPDKANIANKIPPNADSTSIITQLLHGVNAEIVEVKKPEEQSCLYTLALFTGTDSIFYVKADLDKANLHPYGEFDDGRYGPPPVPQR